MCVCNCFSMQVKGVIRQTINKVAERGEKLEDLSKERVG